METTIKATNESFIANVIMHCCVWTDYRFYSSKLFFARGTN